MLGEDCEFVARGHLRWADDPAAEAKLLETAQLLAGWDYRVEGTEFVQGDGHRAVVFGVRPEKVLAFVKSHFAQVRYRFPR